MQNWLKIDVNITKKFPLNTHWKHENVAAGAVGEQLKAAVALKAQLKRWVRGVLVLTHMPSCWHQICNFGANHIAGGLLFTSGG